METADPSFVQRPKPPRSKTSRLGSSLSSSKGSGANAPVVDTLFSADNGKPSCSARALALIGEPLTPPATPPIGTPAPVEHIELFLSSTEVPSSTSLRHAPHDSHGTADISIAHLPPENSRENVRSAAELEEMLDDARKIIEERERGASKSRISYRLPSLTYWFDMASGATSSSCQQNSVSQPQLANLY